MADEKNVDTKENTEADNQQHNQGDGTKDGGDVVQGDKKVVVEKGNDDE